MCVHNQIYLKRISDYLRLINIQIYIFQWRELAWMWRYETEHCIIFHFRFHLCNTVMRQNLNLNWTHLMTKPRPWELFKIFSTEEETQGQVILGCNYIYLRLNISRNSVIILLVRCWRFFCCVLALWMLPLWSKIVVLFWMIRMIPCLLYTLQAKP